MADVITLLSGRAREWATAVWDANAPECQTFSQFSQAMRGVFDPSVSGPAATRQLFQIHQGQRSISDYAIEFRYVSRMGRARTPWSLFQWIIRTTPRRTKHL